MTKNCDLFLFDMDKMVIRYKYVISKKLFRTEKALSVSIF